LKQQRADSLGVDIINTSLGYFEFDNQAYNHTYRNEWKHCFYDRGSEVAFSRGMLLVTSAGNSGNSSNPYIAVPADGISVLAIGAVNSLEVLTSFSSRGPSLMEELNPISWLKDKQQ
jgi:hypothetical protein